jgi:cellulose synthase/poly-beta-1,6-N-acetylglucosamine synthase-like glycosyltransferase
MNAIDILILLLFLISQLSLFIFGVHYFFIIRIYQRNRTQYRKKNQPPTLSDYPKVTIQIPIYNERFVIENVISNIIQLNYPKDKLQIQILDDSNDETGPIVNKMVRNLVNDGFNINHIQRTSRDNFKAGALNNGLQFAEGDFIAIFDADFLPNKEFLKETIPYFFENDKLGCIQTRWGHQNPNESLLTKSIALGIDGHFIVEQNVRSTLNVINFNGTCGIWRKKCIFDSGGWDGKILAEDLDLSYRAHVKGWEFKYLQDTVCLGEVPSDITAFKTQQYRWAKGSTQSAKKNLKKIWQSNNFDKTQKIESTFHHFGYFIQFFMILLFLTSVFLIGMPIFGFLSIGLLFALIAVAAPSMYVISALELGYPKKKIFSSIIFLTILGAGISYNTGLAVITGLFKSEGEFKRTPKKGSKKFGYLSKNINVMIVIEIGLGLLGIWGIYKAYIASNYFVMPFISLFIIGFFWVAILGIKQNLNEVLQILRQKESPSVNNEASKSTVDLI